MNIDVLDLYVRFVAESRQKFAKNFIASKLTALNIKRDYQKWHNRPSLYRNINFKG